MEQKTEHKEDLDLKDLNQYYGTEKYTNVMGFNATDGVVYIMTNGYSWLVTDFLAVAKFRDDITKDHVYVELILDGTVGLMVVKNRNGEIIYTQEYKYTDAKVELKFYLYDNVLLLPSED